MGNLVNELYTDPGERIISDIDILVEEKDFFSAAQLLLKKGYTNKTQLNKKAIKILKHYPSLTHREHIGAIEIHIKATDYKYVKNLPTSLVFARSKAVIYKSDSYLVLSDDDKIKLNFLHSQMNNYGYITAYPYLRDVYDFHLLSKKTSVYESLSSLQTNKKEAFQYYELSQFLFKNEIRKENSLINKFKTNRNKATMKMSNWSRIKIFLRKYVYIFFLAIADKNRQIYLYSRICKKFGF